MGYALLTIVCSPPWSLYDFQIRQTRGKSLNPNRLEHHIHDFVIILNSAIEHDAVAPDRMTDVSPGPEFDFQNGGSLRLRAQRPECFGCASVNGTTGARSSN